MKLNNVEREMEWIEGRMKPKKMVDKERTKGGRGNKGQRLDVN